MILDSLQILIWGISYILMIFAGFTTLNINSKEFSIPYAAVVPNFAWELCAIHHSGGFWGHVLWLGLDIMVLVLNYSILEKNISKVAFITKTIIILIIFTFLFKFPQGMLFSSFIIDFTMSISFLLSYKKISKFFKVPIAITKLIGSAIAALYYGKSITLIAILGSLIFINNTTYLYLCTKEYLLLGRDNYYKF